MLKAIYTNIEDIPAEYQSLYTERNGAYELQVEGMKTTGDVERLQTALSNERNAHKDTRGKYNWVGDLNSDEVQNLRDAQEDLQHQLENRPAGASDEQVQERAEQLAARQMRGVERQLAELQASQASYQNAISLHEAAAAQRSIRDSVDSALTGENSIAIIDSAREDIVPFAERIMELNERGEAVTKDGVGFEPGLPFGEVLADLKASGRRSHWFQGNTGAGASGSAGAGKANLGSNPFAGTPNLTEIGKAVTADPAKARLLAKAAGVDPARYGL